MKSRPRVSLPCRDVDSGMSMSAIGRGRANSAAAPPGTHRRLNRAKVGAGPDQDESLLLIAHLLICSSAPAAIGCGSGGCVLDARPAKALARQRGYTGIRWMMHWDCRCKNRCVR